MRVCIHTPVAPKDYTISRNSTPIRRDVRFIRTTIASQDNETSVEKTCDPQYLRDLVVSL